MKKHTGSNWLIYIIWITAFVGVVIITLTCERESTSFNGIAETREIMISSEIPVEIKRINVLEGQSVAEGKQLLELNSPDLTIRINHISHQLDQLRAQKGVNKDEIRSKIKQLNAEKASRISEVSNQVRQLENQYNLNKELTSGLKSISKYKEGVRSSHANPFTLKIENLRQELALSLKPLNIQIDLLQRSLDASESPLKIQIEQLEKELVMLTQENSKLNIYAQISGVIGSVNFKPGEKVSPFAPILTLHTKNPLFVKGYIHENVYNRTSVGKKMIIASQADIRNHATGTVVGVGARIVEYPIRLRKHPELQVWGREVVIKIPENNQFILGEKVLISSAEQRPTLISRLKDLISPKEIHAENTPQEGVQGFLATDYDMLPVIPLKTEEIEASALLWLEDIDCYLVLSDDTPDKTPQLFLMDIYGRIVEEPLIKGLKKIDDMESVAVGDDGTLYIASSLSVNKNGKHKDSRRLLISVKREGENFSLIQKCDLYNLLKKSAKQNKKSDWAEFLLSGMKDDAIDIEGMFYNDGDLYLGFKTPFDSGESVILKIDRIDEMFQNQKLADDQVSLWKRIVLKADEDASQERISDLFYQNGMLYITGTRENKSGSLWQFDEANDLLTRIATFDDFMPEGIALGNEENSLMICFDQGSGNPSQIALVKVTP